MMNRKVLLSIVFLLSGIIVGLAGCQSNNDVQVQSEASTQEASRVPYSRGPSSPPYVKGPSQPPPITAIPAAVNGASQAVTETESVRYSLPENPDVQVKQ